MDGYKKGFFIIFIVAFIIVSYLALGGMSFVKINTTNEYQLEELMEGEPPIYVTCHGPGYYYQFNKDGESTPEFIEKEKVKDTRMYISDNVIPRVRYNYVVQVYRFSYPGGFIDARTKPVFDSVQFLIPEGTIAEF